MNYHYGRISKIIIIIIGKLPSLHLSYAVAGELKGMIMSEFSPKYPERDVSKSSQEST